jgi:hypothetical protein
MKAVARSQPPAVPAELIERRIYLVRGQKVMLDADLAELYQVETRHLNQAVRRNRSRFPADFMFQLTWAELQSWKSQIVTSNPRSKMSLRKAPLVFTEHGVAMLSSVLRSPRAVKMNILIIRAFIKLRELVGIHKELALRVERIEGQQRAHASVIGVLAEEIETLKRPAIPPAGPRRRIGFPMEPVSPRLPGVRLRSH